MPNNGSNRKNGIGVDANDVKSRKTPYNRSNDADNDDISKAKAEDLVAVFGPMDDDGNIQRDVSDNSNKKDSRDSHAQSRDSSNRKRHDSDKPRTVSEALDSFDSDSHKSQNHNQIKAQSHQHRINRNSGTNHAVGNRQTHDRGSWNDDSTRNRKTSNQHGNRPAVSETPVNQKKKPVAKIVAIACLAVIAVGGIGYAAWNLTPLHSMFDGENESSASNKTSIDAEAMGRKVHDEKLDFSFKHKGITYTFTDLTSVAPSASKSANGRETFKVALKAENGTDSEYSMSSIGVNVFSPNGDYLADMVRNDTVLENENDASVLEDPVIASGGTYKRTLEIPATKSGTYTLEVIDVGTDEIFRVPVDIKVKD